MFVSLIGNAPPCSRHTSGAPGAGDFVASAKPCAARERSWYGDAPTMSTPKTPWKNALTSTFVLAAVLAACGGDDEPQLGPDAATAAPAPTSPQDTPPQARDASVNSGSSGASVPQDAAVPSVDAALDAAAQPLADAATDAGLSLPPGIEACASCALDQCGPKLAACYNDDVCRGLLSCAVTSGCLLTDPTSCVPSCIAAADLDIFETLQQALLVSQLVTGCSSCLADCDLGTVL